MEVAQEAPTLPLEAHSACSDAVDTQSVTVLAPQYNPTLHGGTTDLVVNHQPGPASVGKLWLPRLEALLARIGQLVGWRMLVAAGFCCGCLSLFLWANWPAPPACAALVTNLEGGAVQPPITGGAPNGQPWEEVLGHAPGVKPRTWEALVIHHSATRQGGATAFARFHTQTRGWRSLGYHFVIGNGTQSADGEIETGPRWRNQEIGAHANHAYYNRQGIGICLVGDFSVEPPSEAQLDALAALIEVLCRLEDIPMKHVLGHNHIREGGATACPGPLFPWDEVIRRVQRLQAERGAF